MYPFERQTGRGALDVADNVLIESRFDIGVKFIEGIRELRRGSLRDRVPTVLFDRNHLPNRSLALRTQDHLARLDIAVAPRDRY